MIEKTKGLEGVIVPIITPVDANENINERAFKAIIRRCLSLGADGVFTGGSAGMGPLLTDDQWKSAMEIARDEINDSCLLLGGVMETSTKRAIRKIQILERIGFEHIVVTPTFYITLTDDKQFLEHFEKCRQATDKDMIVYNIPSCTYSNIPLAVLTRMAQEGWYKTIKESSGDRCYFEAVLEIAGKYDVNVLQGNEPDIAWGLLHGASGLVPVCANYEPTTFVTAYQAAKANDRELLDFAQKRIDYLRESLLVKSENWIAGIMFSLSTLGIGMGSPVAPLGSLSERSQKRIASLETVDIRKHAVSQSS